MLLNSHNNILINQDLYLYKYEPLTLIASKS